MCQVEVLVKSNRNWLFLQKTEEGFHWDGMRVLTESKEMGTSPGRNNLEHLRTWRWRRAGSFQGVGAAVWSPVTGPLLGQGRAGHLNDSPLQVSLRWAEW